jgi:predicted RNA-binding Zn-ribbon protein involved in translation (DUF1610 family)
VTRIRATCPSCGEVDLRPADVQLTVVRDVLDEVSDGSCYRFACPTCEDMVSKPADDRIARLLTTGGVEVLDGAPKLEPHPESPGDGPPLTLDDVIALHELLASDAWFSGLESLTR